uniref:Uncharacterized protein n=1 Tax=Panagrolaimus sp. PS1159 TaxID=55785 RepID=A0AC35GJQ2_9BILA
MNFFKLLLIFVLLLFGSFAQRFLRHSINDALIDEKDSDDNLLSSDVTNAQEEGGDVKLTGYIQEIELELDELKFEYCSKRIPQNKQRCMDQKVSVCYDAKKSSDTPSQVGCGPNRCIFEAGVSEVYGTQRVWFMETHLDLPENDDICPTAIMRSPKAEVTLLPQPFKSCEPLLNNGRIKLYVKKATPECFLTVKNAKIWTPTTTPSPTTQASPASEAKGTNEEASNATLIWAIVGGIFFILLIGIIAFVVWYFCIRKQQKTSEKKKIIVETPKHTAEADAVKEKTEEKQPPLKPKLPIEDTKEKKKPVEKEKASKPKKKEKKAEQKIQLKPSKEIAQENVPKEDPPIIVPPKKQAPVEPTLDDPTTGASITAQENEQPHVSVPKHVIHPAPLQPASKAITLYSRSSSRKGSLSERHEIGMRTMVENPSETCIRRSQGSIDAPTKAKLERFYPSDSARPRPLEKREIMLFCCRKISVMFKTIELLIDLAIEKLAQHGAKFGDNETVIELSAEAERYVQTSSTPEYIRSFAFGGIFRDLIDSEAEIYESCPIPLLFVIALQRRYSILNRRQACAWIRRQMPVIFAEFSLKERKKLAYPITAIEDAYNMDPDGFKNTAVLDTESGTEE